MKMIYNGTNLLSTHELVNREWSVYSEEETVIGTYLGKPLYRKVIQTKSPATPKSTAAICSYPEGSNQNTIVSLSGFLYQNSLNVQPINIYAIDNFIFTVPFSAGISMCVTSPFLNKDVRLILEYTKTTDPEGSVTLLPANYVQDYDTEDGWHVRKYSDGYVEMTLIKTCDVNFEKWGSESNASILFPEIALPLTLTRKLSETAGLIGGNTPCGWLMQLTKSTVNVLTTLNGYRIVRPGDNTGPVTVSIVVTGRWK